MPLNDVCVKRVSRGSCSNVVAEQNQNLNKQVTANVSSAVNNNADGGSHNRRRGRGDAGGSGGWKQTWTCVHVRVHVCSVFGSRSFSAWSLSVDGIDLQWAFLTWSGCV